MNKRKAALETTTLKRSLLLSLVLIGSSFYTMKSATDLEEDKFAVLGLKKYCCHCQLSESDTREYTITITRRTDLQVITKKKKKNLKMTKIPKTFCLGIMNSYDFVCDVCLLENDVLIRKCSEEVVSETHLINAVRSGNSGQVGLIARRLTLDQLNAGVANPRGDTALHIACQEHFLDIATLLIECGCNVNVQNANKETPLHQATVLCNRKDIVNLLVSSGAECNGHTANGSFPLQCACVAGHIEYVVDLIRGGAKVNLQNSRDGSTALHKACALAEPEIVRELLLARASKHIRNNAGIKPIEYAIKRRRVNTKYEECVRLMETRGFDSIKQVVLSSDPDPVEAANAAVERKRQLLVEEMEKSGMDIPWEKKKKANGTIYWYCAELDMISYTPPNQNNNDGVQSNEEEKHEVATVEDKYKEWEISYNTQGYKVWTHKISREEVYADPFKAPRSNEKVWAEYWDISNACPYWYHERTGHSTYENPFKSYNTVEASTAFLDKTNDFPGDGLSASTVVKSHDSLELTEENLARYDNDHIDQ
jgi:ankyrin repeat protein